MALWTCSMYFCHLRFFFYGKVSPLLGDALFFCCHHILHNLLRILEYEIESCTFWGFRSKKLRAAHSFLFSWNNCGYIEENWNSLPSLLTFTLTRTPDTLFLWPFSSCMIYVPSLLFRALSSVLILICRIQFGVWDKFLFMGFHVLCLVLIILLWLNM